MSDLLRYLDAWPWELQACLRLALAALLGAAIGLEREHHGRSAGFRTQLLVALGSALAMVVSLNFEKVYGAVPATTSLRIDPARVAYGVMGGIGFLGAGAILKFGMNIRGMTTAASLWCTAAVGLACGFGMYVPAVFSTLVVLLALLVLSRLDRYLSTNWYKDVTVVLKAGGAESIPKLRSLLQTKGVHVVDSEYERDLGNGTETIVFHVRITSRDRPSQFDWFAGEPDILRYSVR